MTALLVSILLLFGTLKAYGSEEVASGSKEIGSGDSGQFEVGFGSGPPASPLISAFVVTLQVAVEGDPADVSASGIPLTIQAGTVSKIVEQDSSPTSALAATLTSASLTTLLSSTNSALLANPSLGSSLFSRVSTSLYHIAGTFDKVIDVLSSAIQSTAPGANQTALLSAGTGTAIGDSVVFASTGLSQSQRTALAAAETAASFTFETIVTAHVLTQSLSTVNAAGSAVIAVTASVPDSAVGTAAVTALVAVMGSAANASAYFEVPIATVLSLPTIVVNTNIASEGKKDRWETIVGCVGGGVGLLVIFVVTRRCVFPK